MKPLRFLLIFLFVVILPVSAQRHALKRDGRVLAHSLNFNPDIETEDMPDGLKEILRAYQKYPRYAQRQKGRVVEPLLQSVRSQEAPFNNRCPIYGNSTLRCVTGCVATCLEQVMNYYRHPEVLADTLYGWTTDNYVIDTIEPGVRIDWDNILNDYRNGYNDAQAQAVADLVYYCGMASHMNWGVASSSANISRAFEPLWRVFDYQTLYLVPRSRYSTQAWNALLRNELENGRPICYTGHNMALSGHAFNIDGVDKDGYYHLNWGYGGDYDGYFDLDYLNPFEGRGDETPLGQSEGFFSNQTALFIHPEDFVIDILDSLSMAEVHQGVVVDDITLRREPDTQGYVIADFSITNHTSDSLDYTFEVLTYLPSDDDIFHQADYVALTSVSLAPGEHKIWPVYCKFSHTGERILAYSGDDVTLPYQMSVTITNGTTPILVFGMVDYSLVRYGDNLVANFSMNITNASGSGYAGNLVTYCLFPEGESIDERHWEVLSLAGATTQTYTTSFQHLEDGRTYTLKVRCPWAVQREFTFTVDSSEATDAINQVPACPTVYDNRYYDLQGRPVVQPLRGIYIHRGRKIFIP